MPAVGPGTPDAEPRLQDTAPAKTVSASATAPQEVVRASSARPQDVAGGTTGALIRTTGFLPLWASGLCWHWARWSIAFLAAYHVNVVTDSPRMVQLTGAVMWAPLLLGGAAGGVISDRFDRLRTVRLQLVLLLPLVVLVGAAANGDWLRLWLLYGLLVVTGVGWVVDMTSRRAHMFDVVGTANVARAMAFESVALASGIAVGNLAGGAVTEQVGVGGAFYVVAGLLVVGLVLLRWVPRQPAQPAVPPAEPTTEPSGRALLREGLALARTNRSLRSILGVTVIMNFFFFAYFPAVQRIGTELDASASQVGLISSMTGFGMVTGSILTATLSRGRWGLTYVAGVAGAMVLMVPFALSPTVAFATVALFVASCGSGLFGATQSTLVLTSVEAEMRGRAMGLLSMAIGALPVGMYLLGELATQTGTRAALITFTTSGLVALAAWLTFNPQVLRLRGPA